MKKIEVFFIIFLSFTSGYSLSKLQNDKNTIVKSYGNLSELPPHHVDAEFKKKFEREIKSFAVNKGEKSDYSIASEQDLKKRKKELDQKLAELERKLVLLEPDHEGKN